MKTKPFVHLHVHTKYSLLDGACHIDQLMDAALENGMPAMAITDHGVMYGVIDFYKTAIAKGIKPLLGCEVYMAPGSRFDRKVDRSGGSRMGHLVLLARDLVGYSNLMQLVSASHLEGFYYKPRIDKEILAERAKGLIGLSACLKGEVASCLAGSDKAGAVKAASEYAEILGKDNFYLEIQDHAIPEQRHVNSMIMDVARETGLPYLATNDVHYLKREHARAHEVLLCLQTQTVMSDPKRMRYRTDEFYLKTRAEMEFLERDFPGCLDRTLEVADRCEVELEFGKLHFPTYKVPKGMKQKEYLIDIGHKGITRRYGIPDPAHPRNDREKAVLQRFDSEMAVIDKTGFVNYFLVVWDFIHFAHGKKIPVGPGRGSGGGSLVAYVLGITSIDPLRYNLLFERFLNPERISPPDFDIDFCQTRRGEVIDYVKDKYGRENVAQIITFGSLGAKTVIRDVGRVLEIPYTKCDLLSKMIPEDPKINLHSALEQSPDFKKAYAEDPDCTRILDYGFVLEGLCRNPGTHAAGVVISDQPLIQVVPLALDKVDEVITQYTMEPLGEIGLLKMDFLGLKTLTVIQETLDLVKKTRNLDVDLDNLSFDDKPTYELLNRGDTVGVFQLESSGMRDLVRRVKIDKIEDLIAMIALYRPGPMNMLDDYVARKTGKAKVEYDHPLLGPILAETYGIMLYQEQVQQAAAALAGFSLAQGDILRRAMGKKKASEMEKQKSRFIDGCVKKNKIKEALAADIFETIAKFAGYGFNKSHSTAYAVIAYQTAYLKANFPCEFMSALISSEIGNSDKLPVFVAEAEAMDIEILPPDVNVSNVRFEPADKAIRFGLAGIKNVGESATAAVVADRAAHGPFTSLIDFCSRIDGQLVNKKVIESLVRSGAFDSVGMHRARLFNNVDFAMTRAARNLRDKRSGQGNLFDMLGGEAGAVTEEPLPDCPPWTESEALAGEKELLGVYMSGHPLSRYAPLLERYQLTTIEKMAGLKDKTLTRLGGIVSTINKTFTKKHEAMAIITLEDLDGTIQVIVWPETYRNFGSIIQPDVPLLVCGEVSRREEPPRLLAQEIYPLADAPKYFATKVSLHIPVTKFNDERIEFLRNILRKHPGETPVSICLQFPAGEKVFLDTDKAYRVLPALDFIHELEKELGEKTVFVSVNPSACRQPRPERSFRGARSAN